MLGLPDIEQNVTLQPAPVVSFDPATEAFSKLADQAKAIAQPFEEQAASEAGANSVTRDAQGNLQAPNPAPPIGPLSEAYNHAAQLRFLSESALDAKPKVAALRAQYDGNPDGFRTALDQYTASVLNNTPSQYQPAVRSMIDEEGAGAQADLIAAKHADDIKATVQSVDALFDQNAGQLTTFATANNLQSPQAQALINRNLDLLKSKLTNPAFNYTQDEYNRDAGEFLNGLQAQAAVGQAPKLYQQYGRVEGEQRFRSLIDALPLSFQTKQAYLTKGVSEIREQDTMSRQSQMMDRQDVIYSIDDARAAALSGTPGGWRTVLSEDRVRAAYPAAHAAQIIENLDEADAQYAMQKQLALASPSDVATLQQQYSGPVTPAPAPRTGSQAGQNIANNNPGNMRVPGGTTFQAFPTMQAGIDAVGHQINLYRTRDGLNTISQIVTKYAPPQDHNDTAAYIADVSKQTGIPADRPLTDGDVSTVRDAMITHEQGGISPSQLLNGAQPNDESAQLKLQRAFSSALTARNRAIAADPASYALRARPDIAQQFQSNDPTTAQAGVRALIQQQRDLGVLNPQPLPKANAASIVAQFSNPPDPAHAADNITGIIAGINQRYGQYAPVVMQQLQKAGLPPEADALWQTQGDPAVQARMATAVNSMLQAQRNSPLPPADARKAFFENAPGHKDIMAQIPQEFSNYLGTLRGPDAAATYASKQAAVSLYAHQLAYEGANGGNAQANATQAFNDVIGSKYNFVDTYRVPVGVDDGAVRAGATAIKNSLQSSQLWPQGGGNVGVPTNAPLPSGISGSIRTAMNFFVQNGWSAEQAAGIVANLQWESGLKPGENKGDGGLAQGIAEWHPDRQANFEAMFGHPVAQGTLMEQLQFVQREITNTDPDNKNLLLALRNATSTSDAAKAVEQYYEQPDEIRNNPNWATDPNGLLAKRAQTAAQLSQWYQANSSGQTRQQLAQRVLSSRGVWVTRDDEKGLRLVWPGDAGYVPAFDAKGQPISYSWSALSAAASQSSKISSPAALRASVF